MNFAKGWPVLLVFRTKTITSKAKNSACFVYISEMFDSLTCPSSLIGYQVLDYIAEVVLPSWNPECATVTLC